MVEISQKIYKNDATDHKGYYRGALLYRIYMAEKKLLKL